MSDLTGNNKRERGENAVGVWIYNPISKVYEQAPQWPVKVLDADGSERPPTLVEGIRLRLSNATGGSSPWLDKLYGRFTSDDGRRIERALCKWHGVPPPDGKIVVLECLEGKFRSFVKKAMDLLAGVEDNTNNLKMSREDHARTMREFVMAQRLKSYKPKEKRRERERLPRLFELWDRFKEKAEEEAKKRQDEFKRQEFYQYVIQRFAAFATGRSKEKAFLAEVPLKDVLDYLDGLGVAPGTYNKHLIVLKRLFRLLAPFSATAGDLSAVKQKDEKNVFHEPFTDAEVNAIIDTAAQVDSLIQSMVIIAVCTGLRLKDICLLRWDSMDTDFSQEEPLIYPTTHKNKGDAELGMWPMLKTELERLWKGRKPGAVYVLPEAAEIYSRNPKQLLTRLEKVLRLLGFGEEGVDARRISLNVDPTQDREALMKDAAAALAAEGCTEGRRQSILNVLDLYLSGKSLPQIAAGSGLSKGTVSNYLHRVEKLTGRIVIRQRVMPVVFQGDNPKPLTVKPERGGLNRVAVRKWHSFRTTFCIAAIRAGIKIETLKKILGSREVDIILKHYFRLNKELMREEFTSKAPAYALNKAKGSPALPPSTDAPRMMPPLSQAEALRVFAGKISTLTPENASTLRDELLKIFDELAKRRN